MAFISATDILSTMTTLSSGVALNGGFICMTNPTMVLPSVPADQVEKMGLIIAYMQKITGTTTPPVTTTSVAACQTDEISLTHQSIQTQTEVPAAHQPAATTAQPAAQQPAATAQPAVQVEGGFDMSEFLLFPTPSLGDNLADFAALLPPPTPLAAPPADFHGDYPSLETPCFRPPTPEPVFKMPAPTTGLGKFPKRIENCLDAPDDIYDKPVATNAGQDFFTCNGCRRTDCQQSESSYASYDLLPCGHFLCDSCYDKQEDPETCKYCPVPMSQEDEDELAQACANIVSPQQPTTPPAAEPTTPAEPTAEPTPEPTPAEPTNPIDYDSDYDEEEAALMKRLAEKKAEKAARAKISRKKCAEAKKRKLAEAACCDNDEPAPPTKKSKPSSTTDAPKPGSMRFTPKKPRMTNRSWEDFATKYVKRPNNKKIQYATTQVSEPEAVSAVFASPVNDNDLYKSLIKKHQCVSGDANAATVLKDIFIAKHAANGEKKPFLKYSSRFFNNNQKAECAVCSMALQAGVSSYDYGCNCITTVCERCFEIDNAYRQKFLPNEDPKAHCLMCFTHTGNYGQ